MPETTQCRPTVWQVQTGVAKQTVEEEIMEAEEIEADASNRKESKPAETGLNTDRIGELMKKVPVLMEQEKLYRKQT